MLPRVKRQEVTNSPVQSRVFACSVPHQTAQPARNCRQDGGVPTICKLLLISLFLVLESGVTHTISPEGRGDARPYRTPVAKAIAFPNNVVIEILRKMGNSAILHTA
ncbi:hypothetical protein JZ751_012373 [Albula glossodonta]|uniref:Uncharacterized protein n=1 Tax=Albula glossodonta TaxID=121402 RepID=A0A8T2PSF9_9TELE|nr:hypothetical protein JZ751_012373 [Albula glossodonta]